MNHRNNYRNMDITGRRFGMLVAVKRVENTRTQWLFQCDCGNSVALRVSRVLHGSISCGCAYERVKSHFADGLKKHGESHTKLYRKYRSILNRCYNKAAPNYKRYGGRGIIVCDEWRQSYEAFRDWAIKTGYDASLDGRTEQSLDRIDNNGPYSPENCRWASAKEQQKNRECTTLYPFHGEMYSASEFADAYGISVKSFVYRRLEKGQSLEYILADWIKIHNVPDNLMDIQAYANAHGIHKWTVSTLIRKGRLKGEKIGRKWYIAKDT